MANPTAGKNESSKNRTLANATTGYSYKNPVIPQGFKAVDIGNVEWRYKDTEKTEVAGWNEGLVIEDVYNQNQFVWVPCTSLGTTETVAYAKNLDLDSGGVKTDITDDTSVLPVSDETAQIKSYGGFYVARFEAGNVEAVNSSVQSDASSANNIGTKAPISKERVKAWNYIDYDNAAEASKLMVNDSSRYGQTQSGLITGKQWDMILAWYKKDEIGVEKETQNWGSYYNLEYEGTGNYFTYDRNSGIIESWKSGSFSNIASVEPRCFHGTGLNTSAIKKNIADIGGNMWEWSAELYSSECVARGGSAYSDIANCPASYRDNSSATHTSEALGFRATLYIQ